MRLPVGVFLLSISIGGVAWAGQVPSGVPSSASASVSQTSRPSSPTAPQAVPPAKMPPHDRTLAVALVYDVQGGIGPCGMTAAQYAPLQGAKTEDVPRLLADIIQSGCYSRPLEDGAGYRIFLLHPRFRADYAATVLSQIDLGSGIIEPRGLAGVAAAQFSAGGVPVAHGGATALTAGAAAQPTPPAHWLEQLLDPASMSLPLVTLTAERRDLEDGFAALQHDAARLSADVTRMTGTHVDCSAPTGDPTLAGVTGCVREISTAIDATTEKHEWTSATFTKEVQAIDAQIGGLALVRSRLLEFNFAAAAGQIDATATQLLAKERAFRLDADTVGQTLLDLDKVLPIGATKPPPALVDLRQTLIKKQLKDEYGSVLADKDLNDLTSRLSAALTDSTLMSRLQIVRCDLAKLVAGVTDAPDMKPLMAAVPCAARPDPPAMTVTAASLDQIRQTAAHESASVSNAVDEMNTDFARMFSAIDKVYATESDPGFLLRSIDTSDKAGTNRVVFCRLTSTERFTPYQLTGVTAAAPAPSQGNGQLFSVPPNPSFTAAPENLPLALDERFSLELHRIWRANIAAGFVLSGQRAPSFGVNTVSQNGQDVLVETEAIDDHPSLHYMVGFDWYAVPEDTFPGARPGARRFIPGVLVGFGIESTKQFYFGGAIEPTPGITLAAGWHWGEINAPGPGITPGQTPLTAGTATAPVRTVMSSSYFLMFGFDLNIFQRLMGTVK